MFVLSRKCDESVIIDGFNSLKRALRVTILEVKGAVGSNWAFKSIGMYPRVVKKYGSESAPDTGLTARREVHDGVMLCRPVVKMS